jgi:hypothetical protein
VHVAANDEQSFLAQQSISDVNLVKHYAHCFAWTQYLEVGEVFSELRVFRHSSNFVEWLAIVSVVAGFFRCL